jgi:flap endonuclease-1
MGLQIGDIVPRKEVKFEELKGKVIAVDAFNAIYQFLASIRQPDGTPLMDSRGKVTSHLSGLFYRNIALLAEGIKLIYVFDGDYHPLKEKTHEKRQEAKESMREKYEQAKDEKDIEAMGRYSRGFVKFEPEMIEECKELLEAMGVGVMQAPGEGEMQCAELVKNGQAFAVGSQDYDAIAVGGKRLIQNLTLSRKKKTRSGYIFIAPEMIEYEKVLNELGVNGDQLICLAILVGTDFNPGGVKGIGPKKALSLVKEKKYPVTIFGELEEQGRLDFKWQEVFEIFKKPNISKETVSIPKLNEAKIREILVDRHDFSLERVNNQLDKLKVVKEQAKQKTLF